MKHLDSPALLRLLCLGFLAACGSWTIACNLGYDPNEVELDGTLDTQPDSAGHGESDCTDWVDNDGDALFDCADPDCQGTTACLGGGRDVGSSCGEHRNCFAIDGDPACLQEWPDGYCSEYCNPESGCPTGSSCVPVLYQETEHHLCLRRCEGISQCRVPYRCQDTEGGQTVCLP